MSHILNKLLVSSVRNCSNDFNKITIELIRLFSDGANKTSDIKRKRPIYTPEDPVSTEYTHDNPVSTDNNTSTIAKYPYVNPECNPDDPECIYDNSRIKYTSANPEYPLEDSDPTSVHSEYNAKNPASIDKPPTTCCMSGCSNCVYIAWAEALSKQMATVDPEVAKKILDKVDDPAMKSFLKMELRNLGIIE